MFNVWSFVYGYKLIVEKEFTGNLDKCAAWIKENGLDNDPVQYRIVPACHNNAQEAIEFMGLRAE